MGIRLGIGSIGLGIPGSRYWTPPSNLVATVISSTAIDLSWDGIGDLSLERSDDGGNNYSEIATISSGTNIYHNTGLTPSTLYYYRARFYKQ